MCASRAGQHSANGGRVINRIVTTDKADEKPRARSQWNAKRNCPISAQHRCHEPDYRLFAGWLPGFGILTHVGRKSGNIYRTPINVFRAVNGFVIALTYSSKSEWTKNVIAAGGCELKTLGKNYHLSSPRVVLDPSRQRFPISVRLVLMLVGAAEYMELSKSS